MSLHCAAAQSNLCELPLLFLNINDRQKHFYLKCGDRKHGPCSVKYDAMLKDKEYEDILDVIAPIDEETK